MTASISFLAPRLVASRRSSRDALRVRRLVAFGSPDPTFGPSAGGFVPQGMADVRSANEERQPNGYRFKSHSGAVPGYLVPDTWYVPQVQ